MVSIVDDHDLVVGTMPRAFLKDSQVNYRVVHVLVHDRAGRLLLQRPARQLKKGFEFGSSVAGHVRAGESYAQAAHREYREELGVDPPALDFLGTTWLDEGRRRKFIGVFIGEENRTLRPVPWRSTPSPRLARARSASSCERRGRSARPFSGS